MSEQEPFERARVVRLLRSGISRALEPLGFDLVRTYRQPERTLLGLGALVPPIRTVIDVGANRGQFAKRALRAFPNARIISFEPQPLVYTALNSFARVQRGRVLAVQSALGDPPAPTSTTMLVHDDWDFSSSLLPITSHAGDVFPKQRQQHVIDVPLQSLDQYLATRQDIDLHPETLIKLDCQGYDDRVIRGGPETFKKARAVIVEVNLDALYQDQPSFLTLSTLLDALGFSYAGNLEQTYAPDGHVLFVDALFVRPLRAGSGKRQSHPDEED